MKQSVFVFTIIMAGLFSHSCEYSISESAVDDFYHIQTDGAQLPVWVRGNTNSEKLVIYINGGPGLTSIDVAHADMFNWSESLEESIAMVYYDQRGCGNAQGRIRRSDITIGQYVKDLEAVIGFLKVKYNDPGIFLMGHSFGAFIGINYLMTRNFQENITGWISIDGAYNFDYDLSWQYRREFLINIAHEERTKGLDTIHWKKALDWTEDNPVIESRDQKNEWRNFIGWPGERIIPEEIAALSVRQYLGIGFSSSYNPFPAYASANLEIVNDLLNADVEGRNLIDSLSVITIPSRLIWGRYDDLIPPEEGRAVFEKLGTPVEHKSFVLMPGSSHEPFISDPGRFSSEILDFLEGLGNQY